MCCRCLLQEGSVLEIISIFARGAIANAVAPLSQYETDTNGTHSFLQPLRSLPPPRCMPSETQIKRRRRVLGSLTISYGIKCTSRKHGF